MSFVHLHTHSDFSLLQGLAKVDDLLDAAKKDGMSALALTDINAVYGLVDFTVKAKEVGIKPIIGAEVQIAPLGAQASSATTGSGNTYQIVLLATGDIGYHNLLEIVTAAQIGTTHPDPRADYEILRTYAKGIIALSGNSTSEIATLVSQGDTEGATKKALLYRDIFGVDESGNANFFLELCHNPNYPEQDKINTGIIAIAQETGIPLVAAGDVYYTNQEDREIHDVLLCIGMNRKVDEGDRPNKKHLDLSFKSSHMMMEAFKDHPEAISNTEKIADRCNFIIEMGNTKLPYYPLPENSTADDELLKLCHVGFERHFGTVEMSEIQKERMEYELGIIEKTGYASYFLIVQDFTNWARRQGIVVGPGRGSAAGSFVSFLTGITNMDPIEYKLLFERFLNPERVSMPDVDMDFADDRRDDVLQYVREKYGNDHVAQIITFGTMAARAAIRDAGRASGFAYDFCDKISKLIPMFSSIDDALKDVPDFKRLYEENLDAKDLIDIAKKLEGMNRHSSIHACGVVITDKPVVAYTALQRASEGEDSLVTQYASSTKFSAVEKIGLLKVDFLGLKNLTIIQNTIKIVEKIHREKIDIERIPLDDKKAFELLQKGQTTGVFQLESSGMKRYLKQLGPTNLEDVIAMVALYRPGPMEWIPDFIDGKHGRKEVTYLDPRLENILSDTYGVAVYQEQVMRIAQDLAGFTLGEADILRKAMGKKIIDLIQEQKIKFAEGCVKNKISEDIANEIFAFIEPFAGYGFNRSHAACYGLIGYQTAYLKAHYPAEFMAALMTSDQGNTDRIAIEAAECREMGIDVLPPSVDESYEEFAVIYDKNDAKKEHPHIRFGLGAIKNVGHTVAKDIVAQRKIDGPYKDLSDFCTRIHSKDLNKRSIEALAKVGAFDQFAERAQIIASMDHIIAFVKDLSASARSNQDSLFGATDLSRATIKLVDAPPATKAQRLDWEKTLLGLYVTDHPATEYKAFFANICTELGTFSEDQAEELDEKAATIGGIIISTTVILLKSGKNMAFVTLEDGTGSIECLIFPRTYEEVKAMLIDGTPLVIQGTFTGKDGELKFIGNTLREITPEENHYAKRVEKTHGKYKKESQDLKNQNHSETKNAKEPQEHVIALPQEKGVETINVLKKILDTATDGPTTIYLEHAGTKMKTTYKVELTQEILDEIESATL